jgi:hypothetical protein
MPKRTVTGCNRIPAMGRPRARPALLTVSLPTLMQISACSYPPARRMTTTHSALVFLHATSFVLAAFLSLLGPCRPITTNTRSQHRLTRSLLGASMETCNSQRIIDENCHPCAVPSAMEAYLRRWSMDQSVFASLVLRFLRLEVQVCQFYTRSHTM